MANDVWYHLVRSISLVVMHATCVHGGLGEGSYRLSNTLLSGYILLELLLPKYLGAYSPSLYPPTQLHRRQPYGPTA